MRWAYQCYYCGREYVRVHAAYKHLCRLQPQGIPLHKRPVFLLIAKGGY